MKRIGLLPGPAKRAATLCLAQALAWPLMASAGADIAPYADVKVEHNSNVFDAPDGPIGLNGDNTRGDTSVGYIAGAVLSYLQGQQILRLLVEGRQFEYNHFSELNRTEYRAGFDWDWKFTPRLTGTFVAYQERQLANFLDLQNSVPFVDVYRVVDGKFKFVLSPDWRLEGNAKYLHLDAPVVGFPDLAQKETTEGVGLKYMGVANLSYGFEYSYVDGTFQNAPGYEPYKQSRYQFAMDYTVGNRSSFNGAVGYTDRRQPGAVGNISGITGSIGYTRALTGKTSVALNLSRQINSYIAAGDAETDTGGNLSVTWNATYRISVLASYTLTHNVFDGQGITGPTTAERVDRYQQMSIESRYDIFDWLYLRPYVGYASRNSTESLFTFSGTTVGLEIRGHLRNHGVGHGRVTAD